MMRNCNLHRGERGAELVEFALLLIPLMAAVTLVINVCWLYFARASLQWAVQAGVRYAVTGQQGSGHQDNDIKSVVQKNAMGFLAGQAGLNAIAINYYTPSGLVNTGSGTNSNASGNLVEITVRNVHVPSMPFVLGSSTTLMGATAADIVETSFSGTPTR